MARRRTYPGSIDQRGDSFRVRLCVGGQRYSRTLHGVTRTQAERHAREKHRELDQKARRRKNGLPGVLTLSALLDRYEDEVLGDLRASTQVSYQNSLRPIRQFFTERLRDPALEDIGWSDISAYLSWRRWHGSSGEKLDRKLSGRSLEKEWSILHLLFEFAIDCELADRNPVLRKRKPSKKDSRKPIIISDEQYGALLAECEHRDDMLHLYALTLGETGARCESEVLHFRWQDVDLEDGFILIRSGYRHATKSGKVRYVPMSERLRETMREHFARYRLVTYEGTRSPWVFHLRWRKRGKSAGDRIGSFRGPFIKAAERAGLPDGFVQHDLRHYRVTKWMAEGKGSALVKEAAGHASITTTEGYTHLVKEHLRALVADPETRPNEVAVVHNG